MAVDERNFRSYYYEKVGFRGVEEKKSLEILWKEKPLDASKLRQFCIRFPVPALYRNLLWKVLFELRILLDILPIYVENQDWVWRQRCTQYDDLSHALDVLGYTTSKTPLAERIVLVWLLEERRLNFDHRRQLAEPLQKSCLAIAEGIIKMFDTEPECYWLSKGFFLNVRKFEKDIKSLRQVLANKLETEDSALYKHLVSIGALEVFPLHEWFGQCFAQILPETALARIWDKLVGGSCKILIYVTLAMLIHLRRPILSFCKSGTEALKYINDMTEGTADLIATKAVDLWQQNGSPLSLNDIAVHPPTRPKT